MAIGTWGDKKFKLKNKFSQLNDADLLFEEGKESELTARLQTKLNKSEADVQQLIAGL
ncbi:MAG: general stress protein CsbD [Flavobacteriales bacterium]|nr:general stress protein CsbD [Flavobacteriales bacterium]MBK7941724.1 general stress protein CsbD [Flavobacteriales bacterium]MBK9700265.1 general stress protein CsbD [Flavobacteriales bacterium]